MFLGGNFITYLRVFFSINQKNANKTRDEMCHTLAGMASFTLNSKLLKALSP